MLDEKNGERDGEEVNGASQDLSRLFEVTAVNFPYPILLTQTDVGDVLQLLPHPQADKQGVLVLYQGQVAGFIALHDQPELFAAMRNGDAYEAVLSENYGGHCRVLVRPAIKTAL